MLKLKPVNAPLLLPWASPNCADTQNHLSSSIINGVFLQQWLLTSSSFLRRHLPLPPTAPSPLFLFHSLILPPTSSAPSLRQPECRILLLLHLHSAAWIRRRTRRIPPPSKPAGGGSCISERRFVVLEWDPYRRVLQLDVFVDGSVGVRFSDCRIRSVEERREWRRWLRLRERGMLWFPFQILFSLSGLKCWVISEGNFNFKSDFLKILKSVLDWRKGRKMRNLSTIHSGIRRSEPEQLKFIISPKRSDFTCFSFIFDYCEYLIWRSTQTSREGGVESTRKWKHYKTSFLTLTRQVLFLSNFAVFGVSFFT